MDKIYRYLLDNKFLIIFIIIVIIVVTGKINKKPDIIEGLNTFNGRMAVDDQYFYDKLFDDVTYYANEYDQDYKTAEQIGKLVMTGWNKCKTECQGHCVEFGVTGHAYCFPY